MFDKLLSWVATSLIASGNVALSLDHALAAKVLVILGCAGWLAVAGRRGEASLVVANAVSVGFLVSGLCPS